MRLRIGTDESPMIPIFEPLWKMQIIRNGKTIQLKEDKMENFETRKLDAADYHKAHPYMKSLDKVLTHYFVTKTEDPAIHGEEYEEMKVTILNSLFHPQAEYDKRVESPNKK